MSAAGAPTRRLTRLSLRGFKSFPQLDIELRPLTAAIGPNGAGKSNLVAFFRLLYALQLGGLKRHVGASGGGSKWLHGGVRVSPSLTWALTVDVEGVAQRYEGELVGADGDELVFGYERVVVGSDTVDLGSAGSHESGLLNARFDGDQRVAGFRAQLLRIHSYQFHDTSYAADVKRLQRLDNNTALMVNGANLGPCLYRIRAGSQHRYDRILSTVRLAAPFIDDLVLEPVGPPVGGSILLRWRQKGLDLDFTASDFSDGTLRFLLLTTLMEQPDPPDTILIDEPELGLHPYAIGLLAAQLRGFAFDRQVIVFTQSVELLDELAASDVIVVDRRGAGSTAHNLDPAEYEAWRADYSLGEVWRKGVIGGFP